MWFMFVIPFIIFFVIFLMIAINIFRGHNHSKDVMKNMVNTISAYAEAEKQESEKIEPVKQPERFCEYCGSSVAQGVTKCEACGAKVKK